MIDNTCQKVLEKVDNKFTFLPFWVGHTKVLGDNVDDKIFNNKFEKHIIFLS